MNPWGDIIKGISSGIGEGVNLSSALQEMQARKRKREMDEVAFEASKPQYGADQIDTPWAKQLPKDFQLSRGELLDMTGKGIGAETRANSASSQLGNIFKIKGDLDKQSKDYIGVRDAYNRVQASANNPSPAGDLSLIFNYMKVLDPGSTVREGEFAQAAATGSLPQQIQAYWDKKTMGFRLTPEQRSDFVRRTQDLYKAQEGSYLQNKEMAKRIAQTYGIDPTLVIQDYENSLVPSAINFPPANVSPQGNTNPAQGGFKKDAQGRIILD